MNAGGHGAQTADVVVWRAGARSADGGTRELTAADLGLGYRTSALGPRARSCVGRGFAGRTDDPAACDRRIDEIVRWRREHQPGGQNAGSVFTNPPGDAAGRLIEACGLQGRCGSAERWCRRSTPTSSWPSPAPAPTTCVALIRLVQDRVEGRDRRAARTGVATRRLRRRFRGGPRMTTTQTPPRHATARINPRIRERRIEVQREAGRRRLRVLLVVSCILSAAGLAFLAVTSPLLDVDHIRVAGAQHVTAAQVRAAAGVHSHDHLLFVDTGAIARRVERLPWVAHASVQRDLPGHVAHHRRASTRRRRTCASRAASCSSPRTARHRARRRPHRRARSKCAACAARPGAGELLAPPDAAGVVARLPVALAQQVAAVDVSGRGARARARRNGGRSVSATRAISTPKAASALAVLAHLGAGALHVHRRVDTRSPGVAHVTTANVTID